VVAQAVNFEKAFQEFDKDGDGTISTQEFSDGLRALGIHLSKRDSADLVRSIDRDGDGTIDYREFAKQFAQPGRDGSPSKGGKAAGLSKRLTSRLRKEFEAALVSGREGGEGEDSTANATLRASERAREAAAVSRRRRRRRRRRLLHALVTMWISPARSIGWGAADVCLSTHVRLLLSNNCAQAEGASTYLCVRHCRVRAGSDLESEEVGSLQRGTEVIVLEQVEISKDEINLQDGRAVAEEYRGTALMRLRIDEPVAGWVSLTMPGGEPQLEPMQ
jgi:hypothetical protein